jgi:transposase-like protein
VTFDTVIHYSATTRTTTTTMLPTNSASSSSANAVDATSSQRPGRKRGRYNKLCQENLADSQVAVNKVLSGETLGGTARRAGLNKETLRNWVTKARQNNGHLTVRLPNGAVASGNLELIRVTAEATAAAAAGEAAAAAMEATRQQARNVGGAPGHDILLREASATVVQAPLEEEQVGELGVPNEAMRTWMGGAQAHNLLAGGDEDARMSIGEGHGSHQGTEMNASINQIGSHDGPDARDETAAAADASAGASADAGQTPQKASRCNHRLTIKNYAQVQEAVNNVINHGMTSASQFRRLGVPKGTFKSWLQKARRNNGILTLTRRDQALSLAQERTLLEFGFFWGLNSTQIKQKAREIFAAAENPTGGSASGDAAAAATAGGGGAAAPSGGSPPKRVGRVSGGFTASNGWYENLIRRWGKDPSLARFREIAQMRRNGTLDSVTSWHQSSIARSHDSQVAAATVAVGKEAIVSAANATNPPPPLRAAAAAPSDTAAMDGDGANALDTAVAASSGASREV